MRKDHCRCFVKWIKSESPTSASQVVGWLQLKVKFLQILSFQHHTNNVEIHIYMLHANDYAYLEFIFLAKKAKCVRWWEAFTALLSECFIFSRLSLSNKIWKSEQDDESTLKYSCDLWHAKISNVK